VWVLVLGPDRFQVVNESVGHAAGDDVLRQLASRLQAVLGKQGQMARFAGDTFVTVVHGLSRPAVLELAERLRAAVALPVEGDDYRLLLTASVGISQSPDHGRVPKDLLRNAEAAMNQAKRDGRDRVSEFTIEQMRALDERLVLGRYLRDAIRRGELELYYQPQLDLKTNKITGAEGLVRWRHPLRGFLTPNFFIGAAERSSQIRPLTWSTLNMALQRASQWPTREPALNIGVNISATLLSDPEFSDMVSSAVGIWDVTPGRLTLEITETALMHELDESYATVKRLHDMGFNISIDDFGTGYSSFSYFRNLPAREIKIDKCFIIKILDHEKDRDIVESLIDLAHKCDLRVVAEGVTDADTLEALRELGCDAVQGYYVAEPMSHSDFLQFLENNRHSWQQN
jgi:diguanylate cyclase (GGDEF)-like protein